MSRPEIVRKSVARDADGGWRVALDDPPADLNTWSTFAAFLAGVAVERIITKLPDHTDIIPVGGGLWICNRYWRLRRAIDALEER